MATIPERLVEAEVDDSLTGRNENPLAAGWIKWFGATATGKCETLGGYSAATGFTSGEDGAYWEAAGSLASSATVHVYVMATIGQFPSINERRSYLVACNPIPGEAANGYVLRMERRSSTLRRYRLERWVNGAATVLDEVETGTYKVNSRLAIVVSNGKVMVWARETAETPFTEILSAEDNTYTAGYSGVRSKGTGEFRLKDFATGTFLLVEPEAPVATTEAATGVTHEAATLNGTVDPNVSSTDYYFEYGETEAYGTKIPVTEDGDAGEGESPIAVKEKITGLSLNTTYHFRLVAVNAQGEDVGADETFTTKAEAGSTVKVNVNGTVVDVTRWIMTPGGLVSI